MVVVGWLTTGPKLWKLVMGEQPYSDFRGRLFPCEPAAPAPGWVTVVVAVVVVLVSAVVVCGHPSL